MAKGRVISARKLNKKDKTVLETCKKISELIMNELASDYQNNFLNDFGKIHFSRDAGSGRSGGKLQRDALCTTGQGKKDPLSNRNLRWHPLVVANSIPEGFNGCGLRIDDDEKSIYIIINGEEWLPENVYKLSEPYCLTPQEWHPYKDILKRWSMEDWNQNNMIIPASEYSPWYDALETYAILGIICVCSFFRGDLDNIYQKVTNLLSEIDLDEVNLPSDRFPSCNEKLLMCPVCLAPINKSVAFLPEPKEKNTWIAPWKTKRKNMKDSDLWTFHMNPLIESEVRHNAQNVRFGHRWCANSKLDHSINYYLDYMKKVLENHGI